MDCYISEKLVLSFFSARLKATVPEISKHWSIPNSTVLGIINRLKKRGILTSGERTASGRGRPVLTYNLRLPSYVCGFIFDGTRLAGAMFDEQLHIRASETIEFKRVETLEQAVKLVSDQFDYLLDKSNVSKSKVSAVSFAINAVCVGKRLLVSSVLPWANSEFQEKLSEQLGVCVKLSSGPDMLANYQKIPSPVPKSVVMFKAGDGVSCHMILENKLFQGASSLSGEIGHAIINPDGPLCGCGRKGCLEAYCSGSAIYDQVINELQTGVKSVLNVNKLKDISPRKAIELIWQSWQDGDTYVRSCMNGVFDKLAWGLGMVLNLIDPEMVIFGGYVLQDKEDWIKVIKRRSKRWIVNNSQRNTVYQNCSAGLDEQLRAVASAFYYD